MKTIAKSKLALFFVTLSLALTACVPNIFDDGSYDMTILEINNPRIQDTTTVIDVRVINRGCPPQSFQSAEVEKSGNNLKIGIRYIDRDGVSTCATFDAIHTVDLGELTSGNYFVQARGQANPSITITVP